MSRITINLSNSDEELKQKIQQLKDSTAHGNPYVNRSESVIAKMILGPALEKEFNKYCNTTTNSLK